MQLPLTREEYERLRELQVRRRWDWPAVFSTNCHGDIWPFARYGYTRPEDRRDVRGLSPVIDEVADLLPIFKEGGGRFFIDDSGAYFKDECGSLIPFVGFEMSAK